MPTIPNFPRQLLEEHRAWHHARMSVNPANPPPGFGADFLEFHRRFIRRALDWYRQQGLDERLVPAVDRAARADTHVGLL
jgi:hypothetical protein